MEELLTKLLLIGSEVEVGTQGNNFPQSNQCKDIHYFHIGRGARFQKHKTQPKCLT